MIPSREPETVLVAHPWLGKGGSEATCMWTLDTLQKSPSVQSLAFTTASPLDWDLLNSTYGTSVDPSELTVIPAPTLPWVTRGTQLVHLQHSLFGRHCKRLARNFGLCISAYNVVDFGTPGVQLLGDFSWNERLRRMLYPQANNHFKHRENAIRRTYLGIGNLIRGKSRPLSDRGDLILSNSTWTQGVLKRCCNIESDVIHPPVLLPSSSAKQRNGNDRSFVAVGRISPEKHLEQSIEILDRLREHGHILTLDIAGAPGGDPDYNSLIDRMVADRDWVTLHGFLDSEELELLMDKSDFGIHACKIEAFGIAVAEMAAHGCLPFVPSSGGGVEIVRDQRLQYSSINDAVSKIETLLLAPDLADQLRTEIFQFVQHFSPSAFSKKLISVLFETNQNNTHHNDPFSTKGVATPPRPRILQET